LKKKSERKSHTRSPQWNMLFCFVPVGSCEEREWEGESTH
jgi:hypothetical protein